jgi:hypothetical protein
MRADAHILDNFIFGQVMELLSGIISIVHRGLTELSMQKIMERAQIQPAVFMKKASLQTDNPEYYSIAAWEVTKCSEVELEYIKNLYREYSKYSNSMRNNFSPAVQRSHQVNQYEIDYFRISSEQVIRQGPPNLSTEIFEYVDGMTFEQKKRVLESIISPEYGGKCVIRWAAPSNISDRRENWSSLPKERFTSGAFRNLPQIVQITFFTDLSRIQALVWSEGNGCKTQPVE